MKTAKMITVLLLVGLLSALSIPCSAAVYFDEDFESYNIGESTNTSDFWAYYPWDVYAWRAVEEGDNIFVRLPGCGNSPLYTVATFSPKPTGMTIDFDFRSDREIAIGLRQLNSDPTSHRYNTYADLITWWANQYGNGVRDFNDYVGIGSGYIPATNVWHHFKQEIKGSVAKVYVDGEFRQEYDFGQPLTDFQLIWGSFGCADDLDNILVQDLSYTIPVTINVEPEKIKMNRGKVPVTIYSTAEFDASTIDQTSITFGVTGNEPSLAKCNLGDVDLDGSLDLVCTFYRTITGFEPGDTTAVLKGKTIDGTPIEGSDAVTIR